jgi:hypothetical protein
MAPDQKKDDGIYTGRLNVRVPAGPAPLRIAATAKGVTVTCNLEAAVIAVEVNSLLSTLQSTRNAASGSRPTAGNFVTVNRDVAFVPPAADLMVVVQGAGDITVKAIDIKPADQAKNVSWVIQRNPADTVAANTPTCPCNAGAEVTVTPERLAISAWWPSSTAIRMAASTMGNSCGCCAWRLCATRSRPDILFPPRLPSWASMIG